MPSTKTVVTGDAFSQNSRGYHFRSLNSIYLGFPPKDQHKHYQRQQGPTPQPRIDRVGTLQCWVIQHGNSYLDGVLDFKLEILSLNGPLKSHRQAKTQEVRWSQPDVTSLGPATVTGQLKYDVQYGWRSCTVSGTKCHQWHTGIKTKDGQVLARKKMKEFKLEV